MKAEKVLKYALEIKSRMSKEDQRWIDIVANDAIDSTAKSVAMLIIEAKKELLSEEAKSKGRVGVLSLANLIMRNGKNNEMFNGAFYQDMYNRSDNHQYFSDGWMLLRLSKKLETKEVSNRLPLNIQSISKWNTKTMRKIENVPTINELKEYIVSCKAEGKRECDRVVQYDFGQDLPKVNAEWLLKGLQAFPNGKLYSEDGISHKGIKLYIMDEEKDEGLLILGRRK